MLVVQDRPPRELRGRREADAARKRPAAPALPATAPAAAERVAVVGAGAAAREAARLLADDSWSVVRLPALPREAASEQLAGASVVIFEAPSGNRSGFDTPESLPALIAEACPEAATIALAEPKGPWPEFERPGPNRPRVVAAPVTREALLGALEAAVGYRNLLSENRILREELRTATRLDDFVGCTAEAAGIRSAITTAAFSEGPVLIVGERGSGRRLTAELIHRLGRRSSLAFVPLQVSSLPAGELRSVFAELRRAGGGPGSPIHRARPGSVYLSGIEQLAAGDQLALEDLLRHPPPFRLLVSADPEVRVRARAGAFGARLLQRLEAFVIRIAPLRERREDVPALALHFLSEACRKSGVGPYGVSGATVEAYSAYNWPGNAGELRMWIERAVTTAAVSRFDGPVLPDAVCSPPDGPAATPANLEARPLKEVLGRIERTIIERALRRARGNQKRAAELLQVNPTTLHEKMKRHGLLRKSGAGPGTKREG